MILDVRTADGQSLVFEWLTQAGVLVVCQNADAPTASEWTHYLNELRRLSNVQHSVLIYTEIHLSRTQQAELREAAGNLTPRVALVSPSTAVRFVASIFTLLNRNVCFFAPKHLDDALSHLHCNAGERALVASRYHALRVLVGVARNREDQVAG